MTRCSNVSAVNTIQNLRCTQSAANDTGNADILDGAIGNFKGNIRSVMTIFDHRTAVCATDNTGYA